MDIGCRFKVYQSIDIVFACETRNKLAFMLINPSCQIVGNTYIEGSRAICHDIDEVFIHLSSHVRVFLSSHVRVFVMLSVAEASLPPELVSGVLSC